LLLKKGNELMKSEHNAESNYLKVDSPYYVKPMLEANGSKVIDSYL
jgi:hypothetical protein